METREDRGLLRQRLLELLKHEPRVLLGQFALQFGVLHGDELFDSLVVLFVAKVFLVCTDVLVETLLVETLLSPQEGVAVLSHPEGNAESFAVKKGSVCSENSE